MMSGCEVTSMVLTSHARLTQFKASQLRGIKGGGGQMVRLQCPH